MRLLIIRHGESEADLLDVHEGRADCDLIFNTGDTGIHEWNISDGQRCIIRANLTAHCMGI